MIDPIKFAEDPYSTVGIHGKESLKTLLNVFDPEFEDETEIKEFHVYKSLKNRLAKFLSGDEDIEALKTTALKIVSLYLLREEPCKVCMFDSHQVFEPVRDSSIPFIIRLFTERVLSGSWQYRAIQQLHFPGEPELSEMEFLYDLQTETSINLNSACLLIADKIADLLNQYALQIRVFLSALSSEDWQRIMAEDLLDITEMKEIESRVKEVLSI